MKDLAIYELVNAKMRDVIDLTTMQESIVASFAQAYPETTDIRVCWDFLLLSPSGVFDRGTNWTSSVLGESSGESNSRIYSAGSDR
jgi:hypothetical protein